MKLPLSGFKKAGNNNSGGQKFKNNRNDSKPKTDETETLEENVEVTVEVTNPSVTAQEEMQAVADNKKKKGRKNTKFNKNKVKETVAQETADAELSSTVIPQEAEIEPVIEKDAEVKTKKEKTVEKTEEISDNTEVAETPKKGRRPNRGSKAKSRKTTKKKAENEE